MKSFLAFLRIIIVGLLWSVVFTEGIRVIMLCNWHFDIFGAEHWQQFRELWRAGWTPHDSKEWALILLIITFFPMILTGWWTLSLVAWEDIIWKILCYPYNLYQRYFSQSATTAITANNRYGIVKRKSYKQIRPAGVSSLKVPISDYGTTAISAPIASPTAAALTGSSFAPASYSSTPAAVTPAKKKTDVAATIDHALFKFDDDDDDFDLDIDSFEKTEISKKKQTPSVKSAKNYNDEDNDELSERPKKTTKKKADTKENSKETNEPKENHRKSKFAENKDYADNQNFNTKDTQKDKHPTHTSNSEETATRSKKDIVSAEEKQPSGLGPVYDAINQKGYDILTNIMVGNTTIDFIGVSETDICFCLVDKEAGDWLADEEMFNGEEPLWFSENSHRVSPVCKLNTAKKLIEEKLENEEYEQRLSFYVVVQMANIINADDMFEIWNDMHINVTRINRGAPKEIKLFSKQLAEANDKMDKKNLDKLRNILKNIK